MKKITALSLILTASVISANALAEWTIPGTDCVSITSDKTAEYLDHATIYNKTESEANSSSSLEVICSSQVHNSYGGNLDMDFTVHNKSKNKKAITCKGFSLDRFGNAVQETESVTQKNETSSPTTLSAGRLKKHSNELPITVYAKCSIPARSEQGGIKHPPSEIINIRVY